jgi:Ca-activated chloride channel homolog
MRKLIALSLLLLITVAANAQSRRAKQYSESTAKTTKREDPPEPKLAEDDIVRIETDLVMVPVRVTEKNGRPVPYLKRSEFRIFEDGSEQEIAYFSDDEQPFTVALMLDMSYSSVFKLEDIRTAANLFVEKLRPNDKVMVVSFDERVQILCKPTSDRKVLKLAIGGTKIQSGTSLYTALDDVLNNEFDSIKGRKAVVLLSDGVDTSSRLVSKKRLLDSIRETDSLIYPIQYDTYDDVLKSRRNDAQIQYDNNDKPYIVETPRVRGEREKDYAEAREFFSSIAETTGGNVYRVGSTKSLEKAFTTIADELRKIYSLGYYPSSERKAGEIYSVKVRIYRPNLIIRTRETRLGIPPEGEK